MHFCYVLPEFDETRNSFSKLLAPVVDRLIEDGHEVTIFSANRSYSGRFKALHKAAHLPSLKIGFLNYLAFLVYSTLWLLRKRANFQVIHNLGVGTTLCQNVMTAHACHRAWVQTKIELKQYPSLILNPLHALVLLVEGLNYRRNIPVIAVCETLAQQIEHFYPATKNRVTVIPNGIPSRTMDLPARIMDIPTISFASNDHHKKGLREILAAMVLAKRDGHLWRLNVLGFDKRQKQWEAEVERLGLSDQVNFRGHVQEIQKHMAASDVFCLPSYYEAFGLVYIEAAQVSCPIVGTRVGVYPDLVGGDYAPLPLPLPVSEVTLYEVLRKILGDPAFALSLAKKAKHEAQKYTEKAMVEKTMLFYKSASFK